MIKKNVINDFIEDYFVQQKFPKNKNHRKFSYTCFFFFCC